MRNARLLAMLVILALVGALAVGCSGTSSSDGTSGSDQKASESFTYAMSGLYKPFNFKESGVLTGFDVEIGEEIARRMGREAVPVTNPWETIIQGLKADKYDAIIGSMAITDERLEQVAFSRPYYRSGAQIFVEADNSVISGEEDLSGKKIGVVKASTFKDIAEDLTDAKNVVGYDSDVIALQDLTTGRIDAVITDQVVGFDAIKSAGLEIKDVGEPLFVDEMGIAIPLDSVELLEEVNAALEAMIEDGTYGTISEKWFGRDILGEA